MDLALCGEVGRSQDGLITRTQALRFLSEDQIKLLLRQNVWTRVHYGVYQSSGSPDSWRRMVRAAILAKNGAAIVSHQSAAYLWDMLERRPRSVDVLTPFGTSIRLPGVAVHRTRTWHDDISSMLNGIPCTTPARTVVDLSSAVGRDRLRHAVDLGITGKLLTLDQIAQELERIGTRGRARCSLLFEVLASRSATFELTDHLSETELLASILEAGLPAPVPQYRIPLGQRIEARPDFAYPEKKIAIESVSWRWHGGPNKFEEDVSRRLRLRKAGWLVVEISRKTSRPDVIAAIESALRDRA